MPIHRAGVLIIRAWLEEGSTAPLRAHIRVADEISGGIDRTVTVTEPQVVGDLVNEWLQGIFDADRARDRDRSVTRRN